MCKTTNQTYSFPEPATAHQVLEKAAEIITELYLRGELLSSPQAVKDFIQYKLGGYEREVFAVLYLDNQHRLIAFEEVFYGTIDTATIHPREVVKGCLNHNAAAVIFAHNHPSGNATPSDSDRRITQRLKESLALIDVRALDHIVAGKDCVSLAEKGWM
ncbi:RadC family protein [Vibrio sp. 1288]|uniref:RadC family protein n=1 Tax=Vibrio sp. 1288 TaxID=3074550 RepID=UPI002966B0DB|nr:DNA repair protein RadC [Vibrio sp. 1288]MDW3136301.1 DNA repair protein RadC [Vibrio sp. 1288]